MEFVQFLFYHNLILELGIISTGVDAIAADLKEQKLTVIGDMDTVAIAKRLKKIGKIDVVSVGPAKEEKEKKKEEKKDEKK